MRNYSLLVAFLALFVLALPPTTAQDDAFMLTILHSNDTHAGHTPNSGGHGGVARQATVQNQIRAEVENLILLDAGDRFSGTLYHTTYLGQDQVPIMNALGYDAMTLGNHEFDNGDEVLAHFVDGLNFPVVSANIDFSASLVLSGLFQPYTVLEVAGQQIGVIGLTTAQTVESSSPGADLVFSAAYTEIANQAAAELMAAGVNKIILLTHLGIFVDLEFIQALEHIDLVIGGHSHTLLSNQNSAAFAYPLVYTSPQDTPVLYVQSGANNLYLGRLDVVFDAAGVLTNWNGDSIFLSRYLAPDPALDALVTKLGGAVQELMNTPIGASTELDLVGDRSVCRVEECSLGNIVADAMRWETGADIALMNGGGIRADLLAGEITLGAILTLHPFGNQISIFDSAGADILAALENSVKDLRLDDAGNVSREGLGGRFLQVSGLRYVVDVTQDPGARVVEVWIEDAAGSYTPLDPTATYFVATIGFIRTGGDGYTMFAENAIAPYDFGRIDYEVTADYLAQISPITADTLGVQQEGRITFVNAQPTPR